MLLLCVAAPRGDQRDEIDERGNAAPPETLSGDEARFELGGVEPARVPGRVVHDETAPQPMPIKLSEHGLNGGSGVDVEIVHDEVNSPRRATFRSARTKAGALRFAVAKVSRRPVSGSTMQ